MAILNGLLTDQSITPPDFGGETMFARIVNSVMTDGNGPCMVLLKSLVGAPIGILEGFVHAGTTRHRVHTSHRSCCTHESSSTFSPAISVSVLIFFHAGNRIPERRCDDVPPRR